MKRRRRAVRKIRIEIGNTRRGIRLVGESVLSLQTALESFERHQRESQARMLDQVGAVRRNVADLRDFVRERLG
jgi:hypothetical protein